MWQYFLSAEWNPIQPLVLGNLFVEPIIGKLGLLCPVAPPTDRAIVSGLDNILIGVSTYRTRSCEAIQCIFNGFAKFGWHETG